MLSKQGWAFWHSFILYNDKHPGSSSITEFIYIYMYIYHCFRSYDWEETLVFTVIGLAYTNVYFLHAHL